ncbi:MAG: methylmalonyl-CoA mutase family protein [Alphaproteobacteria bacterium]
MSGTARPKEPVQLSFPGFAEAREQWRAAYRRAVPQSSPASNRSGLPVRPLYTADDMRGGDGRGDERRGTDYMRKLGFPGQPPWTRGIHPGMHRARRWSQRQLLGHGLPADYRRRLDTLLAAGLNRISLVPCNSYMRGFDPDQVERSLLGTCGVVLGTVDDFDECFADVDLAAASLNLGDCSPFTKTAMVLALAQRRGIPWERLRGTANQSDYLSHAVANHMFFRLSLEGARRLLIDYIAFCSRHMPKWFPLSVVGQHMQQAGATPAEAMGFTLSSALQYGQDCIARGMEPDSFLPRFTFFFDISISFFEEIAKFRAGRRIWARLAGERLGARDPRSLQFRFHAQTSGADLTRQQPLNNIARVAVQAMAGIFGGLQSLHTDSYDEAFSAPTQEAAGIAIATQNILCEEAHLTQVIDPLGGAYYIETLTDEMEAEIERVIALIDEAGGMHAAVESGLVQGMIGRSSLAFQERVEAGEETVVGVNAYRTQETAAASPPGLARPAPADIESYLERLRAYKAGRDMTAVTGALDGLARAASDRSANLFEAVVAAALAGATHGEICARARECLGDGVPLVAV